jgi:hypothetical protein
MVSDLINKTSDWWEEMSVCHFMASHADSSHIWAEDEVMNGFMYYHNSILVRWSASIVEEEEFKRKYFLDGIDAYYDCYYRNYTVFLPIDELEDFFKPYWQRHMAWDDAANTKSLVPAENKIVQPVISGYRKEKTVIEPSWLRK